MPLRRIALVANPRAGRVGRETMAGLAAFLRESVPTDLLWTAGPGHATALAALAGADPDTLVAVAGGDGSLHEALQGLPPQGVLGLIPAGTADVAARGLGIPRRPAEAARLLLCGRVARLDLGAVRVLAGSGAAAGSGERRFLLMMGTGFDAHVAARVPALSKRWLRKYAYHLQSALLYPFYRPPRLHATLGGDGVTAEPLDGCFSLICNFRRYGGDLFFAPAARWDDGLLDLVLARDLRPPALLAILAGAFAGRGAPARVAWHRRTAALTLQARDGPVPWQLDGEVYPPAAAWQIAVRPGALRMVVP